MEDDSAAPVEAAAPAPTDAVGAPAAPGDPEMTFAHYALEMAARREGNLANALRVFLGLKRNESGQVFRRSVLVKAEKALLGQGEG